VLSRWKEDVRTTLKRELQRGATNEPRACERKWVPVSQFNNRPAVRSETDSGKKQRIQHHLFIDFKAAYDTITRNGIYVIMVELDFPATLIRLTTATLTTVKCCVKIQKDCSDHFETQEGLRQGDV
jgi:hypothetical protein